jgi:hypothetical protein
MKTFHIIIISVASLVLIATSLLMYSQYGNKNPFFPPVSVNCPDYWKLNSDGKCVIPNDGTNMGNIKGNQIYEYQMINKQKVYSLLPKMYNKIKKKEESGNPYDENLGYYTKDFPHGYDEKNPQKNIVDFNHVDWNIYGSGLCEKQKWANVHNIAWDGVSNFNHCKPPDVNK